MSTGTWSQMLGGYLPLGNEGLVMPKYTRNYSSGSGLPFEASFGNQLLDAQGLVTPTTLLYTHRDIHSQVGWYTPMPQVSHQHTWPVSTQISAQPLQQQAQVHSFVQSKPCGATPTINHTKAATNTTSSACPMTLVQLLAQHQAHHQAQQAHQRQVKQQAYAHQNQLLHVL
jgi:hypothetical protein